MPSEILIHEAGGCVNVTLQRSDRGNALSDSLVASLCEVMQRCTLDGARVLVLTGEGKSFCSGFDFTGIENMSDGDIACRLLRIEFLLQAIHHAPFPTLCFAHGNVVGAGVDIVAACTRRICDPKTTFRMPGLAFGVVLGTRRFLGLVGTNSGFDILSNVRSFDAAEARTIGFVEALVERERWPEYIASSHLNSGTLPGESMVALRKAMPANTNAVDVLELARSVTRPGLRDRMIAYRAQVKAVARSEFAKL